MKKFFSLIAAVLFAGSMMAIDFTLTSAESVTQEGVTVTFSQGTGSNAPAWYTNGLRLYVANEVTISSESTITGITFNWEKQGTKAFNTATASVGEYTHPTEPGQGIWTGSANSVTFTLGASGQLQLNTFSVTLAGGEVPPVEPETIPTTAPAVPAQDEANVMAIYCNHYTTNNANFGISGWAGGYQTLDLNGTMAAYWTGMSWECIIDPVNTDAAHDYSAYENVHVDMWAPAAAKIKFTAEAVAGGNYKDGQVLDLVQGWNSFDIALANWAGNYDFANLKCFVLEQYKTPADESFEGNPFAIANIYFWNTPALADPTNCAEAREAALSVSANNELYNNGAVYTIEGYVTGIKTAYSDQYHNISFWMADAADGGEVIQAFRAACASEADAPAVGDKVAVTGSLTKYNGTPQFAAASTFVITERAPQPTVNYYVCGSMTSWAANEAYMLTPNNENLYQGEFTFAANDEFKVIGVEGETTTWYPDGMDNNFQITEAGDYKITFNPAGNVEGWYAGFYNVVKKEAPIVHQYEVAEAIAAGLTDDTEILVRGVITKMEFKGANFAKYGSVNIYVADATDAEGEFEFYNCYSLNADTFRTSIPNYDPTDKTWVQLREVADANGNAIHVGDTVIAFGKYKLYNTTHELNQGCYLVDIKHAPVAPADTIELEFNTENTTYAFVDNQYFVDYGTTDIYLSDINVNTSTYEFEGDGNYLVLDFYPEDPNNVTGVYQALDETLDLEYTYMLTINGTDTTVVEFANGAIQVEIGEVNKELGMAQLALAGQLISTEGDIYVITALVIAYYDFIPEEGVEDVVLDPKAIKSIVNGQVVIEKAGKTYNMNGQIVK